MLVPVEIKSAATFSNDFLTGIEKFRALGVGNVAPGAVLYNGNREFNIREIRIFNPLDTEDVWGELTGR